MKQAIRRIGIIGFEGANALDMVGPLEAFASTASGSHPAAIANVFRRMAPH